jgi:hypothetical protein
MEMRPLTPQLLRARTVAIYERVFAERGPVEDVIFERIVCDDCGAVVNFLRDGHPIGWTTDGDAGSGWRDLCKQCSATSVYREIGEPRVRAFGEWDAPITDDAEWIDAPTDLACMFCRRRFEAGDNGAILPTGFATHRDCILRAILGGSA